MRKLIFYILFTCLLFNSHAEPTHGDKLKMECTVCHFTDKWNKIKTDGFNHKQTSFPLLGQHKIVECRKCHPTLDFSQAKSECFECHADVHQGTVGRDCENCHNAASWMINNVKPIHQQSGFPLTGAHAAADCQRCHTSASNLRFNNLRTDCFSCHKQQYDACSTPNHKSSNFSTDCTECHNMTAQSWMSIGKNFHAAFPLTAGHSNQQCVSCHTTRQYRAPISADCYSCHKKEFDATLKPNHVTSKFDKDCTGCHSIVSWLPTTKNFHQSFPLTAGHASLECISCHFSGDYSVKLSPECASCHGISKAAKISNMGHVSVFSKDCALCHTTQSWTTVRYAQHTGYEIYTGAHKQFAVRSWTKCIDCHNNDAAYKANCQKCHPAVVPYLK